MGLTIWAQTLHLCAPAESLISKAWPPSLLLKLLETLFQLSHVPVMTIARHSSSEAMSHGTMAACINGRNRCTGASGTAIGGTHIIRAWYNISHMHNNTAKDSIKSTTAKLDRNFLDNLKKGRYTHRQLNDMVYDELGHIHCTEVACQAYNGLASRRECPALGRGGQLPPPLPPSHSTRVQLGWAGKVSTGKVCLLAAEEAMVPAWGG